MSTDPDAHNPRGTTDRYRCPITGEPLMATEDGWLCLHKEGSGDSHETVIAIDAKMEMLCEQYKGGGIKLKKEVNVR